MNDVVIRNDRVEPELWRILSVDEAAGTLPAGPIVVPLGVWKARRDELLARREPLGVWLEAHEEPAQIAADLEAFALVALHFPKFTDGRSYSNAVLLRTRHGYRGELRAFGDVGRDQLFYLKRCGFTSFRLPPHRDPEAALGSLAPFSVRYQGSVDDPLPLFRKRARPGGEVKRG
jgi:uncharacterized protein (DUF934 family)